MKVRTILIITVLFSFLSISLQAQKISSKEAYQMTLDNTNLTVIDVRTPYEFQSGHIKGAININVINKNFYQEITKLDKNNRTYLILCETQPRGKKAFDYMVQEGFKHIYLMNDGYVGWVKNGLPTVP